MLDDEIIGKEREIEFCRAGAYHFELGKDEIDSRFGLRALVHENNDSFA
jgi:hypothetical protein